MNNTAKPVQQAEIRSTKDAPARRAFVKPSLERHERLPEITGFSF